MIHLYDLPVLSEIFSYLEYVNVRDVCSLSCTCRSIRQFFENNEGLKQFWYQMLLRAAHQKYRSVNLKGLNSCYQQRINPASFYFIRGIEDVREVMGECRNRDHLRYKVDASNINLHSRDLHREWQAVMWRRNRSIYWSSRDELKLCRLLDECCRLELRKRNFLTLNTIYEDIVRDETNRLRQLYSKNKKE